MTCQTWKEPTLIRHSRRDPAPSPASLSAAVSVWFVDAENSRSRRTHFYNNSQQLRWKREQRWCIATWLLRCVSVPVCLGCACINCVVFQSRQDASRLWNSGVSSHGEMGVPMATVAQGGHWITLALFTLPLVSLSVSRVIKDCTLINFSALSRAKCPGRGLCVWPCVCMCVLTCACVCVCVCPCACSRLCYVCVLAFWIHSCHPFSRCSSVCECTVCARLLKFL